MFVRPEDAKNMYCCKDITQKCKGDRCMGWRFGLVEQKPEAAGSDGGRFPLPPKRNTYTRSEKGYCGFIRS